MNLQKIRRCCEIQLTYSMKPQLQSMVGIEAYRDIENVSAEIKTKFKSNSSAIFSKFVNIFFI